MFGGGRLEDEGGRFEDGGWFDIAKACSGGCWYPCRETPTKKKKELTDFQSMD